MRTHFIFLFFCTFLFCAVQAQDCYPVFSSEYGGTGNDEGLGVVYNLDGSSTIAGKTTTNAKGGFDGFLMRLSPVGDILWSKNFGGMQDDELYAVIQTSDGGFLALGSTKSFGNADGEPFLLKTSADGEVTWARTYISQKSGLHRATSIRQVKDGGYVLLVNLNDGASNGDAVVLKLSSSGAVQWSRLFDNGAMDGLSSVAEKGDTLIVGGFSTNGPHSERYGIVSKLMMNNGQLANSISIRRIIEFAVSDVWNNNVMMVEPIPGGLAFSMAASRPKAPGYFLISHFKMMDDGRVTYQRTSQASTALGGFLLPPKAYYTPDEGFLQLIQDTGWLAGPEYHFVGPLGIQEHGKALFNVNGFERARMSSMAIAGNDGYMAAGGVRNSWGTEEPEVRVVKLGRLGRTGLCNYQNALDFIDSSIHVFSAFSWKTNGIYSGSSIADIDMTAIANGFVSNNSCKDNYCEEAPVIPEICNSTFQVDIKSENGLMRLYTTIPARQGGYIGGGEIFYYGHLEPVLARIKSSGAIEWSVSLAKYINGGTIHKILETNDGNYMAMGVDYQVLNHGASKSATLTKVNASGQVIWSKSYDISTSGNFVDIIDAGDGGYFAAAVGAWGLGHTYTYIYRLSASGDVVWAKQTHFSGGAPAYKTLLLEGNDLYVGADYYSQTYRFRLEKWDATTGAMKWQKRYKLGLGTTTFMKKVVKVKDTLYAIMKSNIGSSMFFDEFKTTVVKILDNGDLAGGYLIDGLSDHSMAVAPFAGEHKPYDVLITQDHNIVVAQQVKTSSTEGLAIMKFSPQGNKIFSVIYPELKDKHVYGLSENTDNLLITGRIYTPTYPEDVRVYSTYLMNVDANGVIDASSSGKCSATDLPFSLKPIPDLGNEWNDFDSVGNARFWMMENRIYYYRPLETYSKLACNLPSTCSTLDLQGADTICNLSNVYTYTLIKNTGCQSPAVWLFDSTKMQVTARSDSSISIRFTQNGSFALAARLTSGCNTLGDQINITVPAIPGAMNLGKDTSICTGNQLLLRAGSGYTSYAWQDGNTDSVYQVRSAGTYHVKVTDVCGRVGADTIVVQETGVVQMQAGQDRTVCAGDTVSLKAPGGYSNYIWRDGVLAQSTMQQEIIIRPVATASYIVTAERSVGCLATDTILVTVVQAPVINLGKDTSFCQGGSVLLDPGTGFMQYNWSTGSSNRVLEIKQAGIYHLMALDPNGCKARDTFEVKTVYPSPRVQLARDLPICEGKSVVLSAPSGMQRYRWSDETVGSSLQVSQIGKYWVEITDNNGCKGSDTTSIAKLVAKVRDFLPADQAICSYDKLTITPNRRFEQYQWSTNDAQASIIVSKPGTYWVNATDNFGCVSSDSISISYKECVKGFYVPNIFTPNNDGKNDRFKPLIYGKVVKYEIQVFNRFGERVFQSKDPSASWDGNVLGQQNPVGTFTWLCVYQLEGEDIRQAKGTVTIVR